MLTFIFFLNIMNTVHKRGEEMPKVILNIREEIIKSAFEILRTEDFSEFNIRHIAKKCNIGTGTVYNYFASKEEIILAIADYNFEALLNEIDEKVLSDYSQKEKMRIIFDIIHKRFIDMADDVMKKIPDMLQPFLEKDTKTCIDEANKRDLKCVIKAEKILKEKLDIEHSFTVEVILRIISWYGKYEEDQFEKVWTIISKLI